MQNTETRQSDSAEANKRTGKWDGAKRRRRVRKRKWQRGEGGEEMRRRGRKEETSGGTRRGERGEVRHRERNLLFFSFSHSLWAHASCPLARACSSKDVECEESTREVYTEPLM